MCMLCVIPPNVIPSREKLENSALNNPHGFGFAIVIPSENRIHAERTMDADASISKFLEMRKRHPEGYAMWHARYATHGSRNVENCHPFRVNGDRKTYLAHNGILPVLEDDSDRSDTRIFAEDVIPAMGGIKALDNEQVWNILEDFTTGSKVCILTVDPEAKHQMYLLHEEKGKVDESGVWWSNDSCYLDYGWGTANYKYKSKDNGLSVASTYIEKDSKDWLECDVCEAYISKSEARSHGYSEDFCEACGSCYGCATYISDCLCYGNKDKDKYVNGSAWSYQGVEGWKGWDW
jgi:predicted glutamine amidotransferase